MNKFDELLNRKRPEVVYHYTSFAGFKGIIEERAVWATDIRFLNDVREFRHCLDLSKQFLLDFPEGVEKALLSSIFEIIFKNYLFTGKEMQVCVASFSAEADLLSQWRGYCPEGRGVCLGINPSVFGQYADTGGSYSVFASCEYDAEVQRQIIAEEMGALISITQSPFKQSAISQAFGDRGVLINADGSQNVAEVERLHGIISQHLMDEFEKTGWRLFRAAALMKHTAFKEEAEWRLILPALPKSKKFGPFEWRFRPSKSNLIPYISVPLAEEGKPLEIAEVIVGPSPDRESAIRSLERFLEVEGVVCANVRVSTVPYKNW